MVFGESFKRPYTMGTESLPIISTTSTSDYLSGVVSLPPPHRGARTHQDRLSLSSIQYSYTPSYYRYVASSTKLGKGLDMDALERRRREREMTQRYRDGSKINGGDWGNSNNSSSFIKNRITKAASSNRQLGSNFIPMPAKQVYFVLNGQPSRIYRALLNPVRSLDFEFLLEEVSQGLQIAIHKVYTYDGRLLTSVDQLFELKDNRALAVPRNERLILHGRSYSDLNWSIVNGKGKGQQLLSIRKEDSSGSSSGEVMTGRRHDRRYNNPMNQPREQGNSIERPPKKLVSSAAISLPHATIGRRRYIASLMDKQRLLNGEGEPLLEHRRKNKTIILQPSTQGLIVPKKEEEVEPRGQTRLRNKKTEKRKHQSGPLETSQATKILVSESQTTNQKKSLDDKTIEKQQSKESGGSATSAPVPPKNSNSNTADSDSGRPRSSNDFSNGGATTTHFHDADEFDEVDEEDAEELEGSGYGLENEDSGDDYPQQSDGIFEEENEVHKEEKVQKEEDEAITPSARPILTRYGSREERAAIRIQAATRGYLTRKKYKIVKFSFNGQGPPPSGQPPLRAGTPLPDQSDLLNSESAADIVGEDREEPENEVERLETPETPERHERPETPETPERLESSKRTSEEDLDDIEEKHSENFDINGLVNREVDTEKQQPGTESGELSSENEDEDEALARRSKGPNGVDSYSVTVKLGNRWAADSESELYISMIGDKRESDKFYMRQKYVNWLENEHLNYVQQASDTFQMQIECGFLGIIRRLVVGHDSVGYGAGIFIDRIIITEDAINGRAYLFQCQKWLDSGQVDGKLKRSLRLTAYCDMDPIPHAVERLTHGRWEVILYSGDSKGAGGTTSDLRLVGFGTRGSAETIIQNEQELRQVPSKTLVQCHFKDIGELLKLRVELCGGGDSPDYFIDQVELRDLDTQDRCIVPCGKWLRWNSTRKGDQPFREFLTFRLGAEPLPLINYDGKLHVAIPHFQCIESVVRATLVGDIGETGVVLLDLNSTTEKGGKRELGFKVEAVSIGKVNSARLYMDPTDIGQQIYEGFDVLQGIWDRRARGASHMLPMGTTGNDWLTGTLLIREGPHTPYRYVLSNSRIRPRTNDDEPFIKELRRSALEGMSTRINKNKMPNDHRTPSWVLSMSIGENSRLIPHVFLCGTKDNAQMTPITEMPNDNLLSFQLKDFDLGNICKVRLKTDQQSLLKPNDEEDEQPVVYIKRMRLSDNANGDEIRFPSADVEMDIDSIVEFPVFWPDRPPLPNIVYEARVITGISNLPADANVWLNIFGSHGDVSYRRLQASAEDLEQPLFSAESSCVFEFEAVSIGALKTAEITVECKQAEFLWECTQLIVSGSLNGQAYIFQFSKPFTASNNRQNASVLSSGHNEA